MSAIKRRVDLQEVRMSASSRDAALRVVERLTREREELAAEWSTAVRLAKANGASLRDIAEVAGVSPQTIANIVND
ncbi:MAG: hypothetical protein ACKOBG_06970 [Actinomycetota bacterium]